MRLPPSHRAPAQCIPRCHARGAPRRARSLWAKARLESGRPRLSDLNCALEPQELAHNEPWESAKRLCTLRPRDRPRPRVLLRGSRWRRRASPRPLPRPRQAEDPPAVVWRPLACRCCGVPLMTRREVDRPSELLLPIWTGHPGPDVAKLTATWRALHLDAGPGGGGRSSFEVSVPQQRGDEQNEGGHDSLAQNDLGGEPNVHYICGA